MSTLNIEKLREAINGNKLDVTDLKFALGILRDHDAGTLKYGKALWIDKLLERVGTPKVTELSGVGNIFGLLSRAQANGVRFPELWLQLPDRSPLRISIAGEKSQSPGSLTLTDGGGFHSSTYFGSVSPAGVLALAQDGFAYRVELLELMSRLEQSPAPVMTEFGHITGFCGLCQLPLKDDEANAAGYHQACARTFGLPWDTNAARKLLPPGRASKTTRPVKGTKRKARR